MLKHYVTFMHPGLLFPTQSVKEIKSRSEKIEVPENCFAYYFWDKELLTGNVKNKSGCFYLNPVPVSLQDKNMDREFLTLATDILLLVERCQKQGIGDGNTIKRIAQELIKIKTEDI